MSFKIAFLFFILSNFFKTLFILSSAEQFDPAYLAEKTPGSLSIDKISKPESSAKQFLLNFYI